MITVPPLSHTDDSVQQKSCDIKSKEGKYTDTSLLIYYLEGLRTDHAVLVHGPCLYMYATKVWLLINIQLNRNE